MLAFEPVVREWQPDWVVVVGDVNSTVACALVASKLGVPVGARGGRPALCDRTMPEEINRLVTTTLADLSPHPVAGRRRNLPREGVDRAKIDFVGNVMIDTLVKHVPKARARPILADMRLDHGGYASSPCIVLPTLTTPTTFASSSKACARSAPSCPSSSPYTRARAGP